MAELTEPTTTTPSCCSAEAQSPAVSLGEGRVLRYGSVGHAVVPPPRRTDADIRETVREKYAAAARAVAAQQGSASCCGPVALTGADETRVFGAALYDDSETEGASASAVAASLGCGVPTAVADLHEGETVLDLGSGAGADVLISARRVGPTGTAIGLDMTDEMLELARANAAQAGVENVEFVKGFIEDIPLPDGSVDVIVSNCVLNLSGDKPKVLREAARVLRPGGRFAVSDVIASPGMDDATRADLAAYTGCIAGALTEPEFRDGLAAAGFVDVEIRATHQVHEFASSAIIRARKPGGAATIVRQVELFEPAMCCPSGVCGPSVDQNLIDIREDIRWAETQGAEVSRHNLSADPGAFVANPKVTGLMQAFGETALPALLVDGDIVMHGRYPSRAELAVFVGAAPEPVDLPVSTVSGCGCGSTGSC